MRAPAQGAVEGVAVGVGEAGHGQPGEPGRIGRRRHAGVDGGDAVAVDGHEHVALGLLAAEPRQLAVVLGEHLAIIASLVPTLAR